MRPGREGAIKLGSAIWYVFKGILKTPFKIDKTNKITRFHLFGGNRSGFLKRANVPLISYIFINLLPYMLPYLRAGINLICEKSLQP
jgi:hypothetical protein